MLQLALLAAVALAAPAGGALGQPPPTLAEHCKVGTPIVFGGGNPGCTDGKCCAADSTHADARKCVNSTDCLGCAGCSYCFESHSFAGNWCQAARPPAMYTCEAGGRCGAAAPGSSAGVDLGTCQRMCLKDGYAQQRVNPPTVQVGGGGAGGAGANNFTQPGPVNDIGSRKHIFVDNWMISGPESTNVTVAIIPPGDLRQVIFADRPWEEGCMIVANYASVLRRPADGRFMMWYNVLCGLPYAPGGPNGNFSHVCYAESVDGLQWTKPALGLVSYRGTTQNNIAPLGGVWLDPAAPAAHRYKAQTACGHAKPWVSYPMCYYASPDGLRGWVQLTKLEIGQCDGMGNLIFFDQRLQRYQLYARHWIAPTAPPGPHGKCPSGFGLVDNRRLCVDERNHCARCYRTVRRQLSAGPTFPTTAAGWGCSDDPYTNGDTGCNLTMVIGPDAIDAAAHPMQEKGQHKTSTTPLDYYGSMVWPVPNTTGYPDQTLLMFSSRLWHFSADCPGSTCGPATTDVVLSSSRTSGASWLRTSRAPLLSPGVGGSFSSRRVWALGQPQEVDGKQLLLFFGGQNVGEGPPPEYLDPRAPGFPTVASGGIGVAVVRLDGLGAAVPAQGASGVLALEPLRFIGNRLLLNVATAGSVGAVLVELAGADGTPLPGFSFGEATPVVEDAVDAVVRWGNNTSVARLSGQVVRLRFRLRSCQLHSFRFVSDGSTVMSLKKIATNITVKPGDLDAPRVTLFSNEVFNFFIESLSNVTATTSIALVGAALEDINYSLYPGLYSQLIMGESFEEPALQGLMPKQPLKSWFACAHSHACHATWAAHTHSRTELNRDRPHTGKQALRLTADATKAVSNMGLGRWGLNFTAGVSMEGRLFLRTNGTSSGAVVTVGACPAHDDGAALPSASECYGTVQLLNEPVSSGAWVKHTFTLTPSKTDGNASFVIWLGQGFKQVDVDDVLLEPARSQRWHGQHVRKDMAEAMLLERPGGQSRLGFVRFGGDAADASTYSWRNMRGPAALRPPRTPGSWDPVGSNGFGVFEFMQMREAAQIPFAVLDLSVGLHDKDTGKCGNPADSPDDAADLIEYMISTDTASKLAQLRSRDGHPLPYSLHGLIFEISNECTAALDYFTGSLNQTIAAMVARVALVGGEVLVRQLQFGSMGDYDWQDKRNSPAAKDTLIHLAQFWQLRGVQLYSDQHMGGGLGPGQQQRLARIPFPRDYSIEVLLNYSMMHLDIKKKGGGLKMYVGEEDCAADKNEANDLFCHAHWRGLTHAFLNSGLARLGSFVNGNGPCNTFGATGRQERWPQALYEFSKGGVLKQPPALIQAMLAESFGRATSLEVIGSSPERFTSRSDNTSVLDLLVLKNIRENSLSLRIVNSFAQPANMSVRLPPQAAEAPNVYDCIYLACDLNAVNSWQRPHACYPEAMPNDVPGARRQPQNGVLSMTVPAFSFTVCTSQPHKS